MFIADQHGTKVRLLRQCFPRTAAKSLKTAQIRRKFLWHNGCFPEWTSCRMIEALFNQPGYVATKKMLDATAMRHEAIASNLANVETPHYKRIDVAPSFQEELRAALGGKNPDQIRSIRPTLVEDTNAIAGTKDGNTVELETELMNLNQNTLAHTVETHLATGALLKLRLAITGRPG